MQRPEIDNIKRFVEAYRAKGEIGPENTAVEGIEACLRWIECLETREPVLREVLYKIQFSYVKGTAARDWADAVLAEIDSPAPDRAVTREEG